MKCTPLKFDVIAECPISNARVGLMALPHSTVNTPVFMPVGTRGTIKGLLPQQVESLGCQIILGNTYHLGTRPGSEIIKKAGGLHKFMGWNRSILTDSGGFQMVSLLKLAEITENGVKFQSPYGDSECMLTPEHSIKIQNDLGADIIMQLDDVVSSTTTGPRVEEAMLRTTRWLDRCLSSHSNPHTQNIFPIVQGGLNIELRKKSASMQCSRTVNGFAIGGLSGGESKNDFWKMVHISAQSLPRDKPRYLMGVGFPEDMLLCCALGVDMFDCVHPTRTARFGSAITMTETLYLKNKKYECDFEPIEKDCQCYTCKEFTRAYLNSIVTKETVACHLLTIHNIHFQMNFMRLIRENIIKKTFPDFVKYFMKINFPQGDYPKWLVDGFSAKAVGDQYFRIKPEDMDFNVKKLVKDAGTAFNRVVQRTEERLGTSGKTELDSHLEHLAERSDSTKLWTEKIMSNTLAVLIPNISDRVEDFLFDKIDKKKPNRLSNLEYLGNDMIEAGNDFGAGTPYGSALIKVGQCEQRLGQTEREFISSAHQSFVTPLRKFLDDEIKTIQKERSLLEIKRLDLDSCKSKHRKARCMQNTQTKDGLSPEILLQQAERDLRIAQSEFDRQAEITKLLLEGVNNSAHANHLRCLHEFVESQLWYYTQCKQIMQDLQRDLASLSLVNPGAAPFQSLSLSPEKPRDEAYLKYPALKARAVYDYDAKDSTELSLLMNEVIIVREVPSLEAEDYVMGERGSQVGKVPKAFVEIISYA